MKDLFTSAIARFANDPAFFFTHALRVKHLWQGELDILRAVPCAIAEHKPVYIASGHACCAKGTLCRMADGTVRSIEQVEPGDRVMGDDSTPRTVLSCLHGRDRLYKVRYFDGTEYVHNGAHELVLRQMSTQGRMRRGRHVTVPVREWLTWGSKYQRRHCGFRRPVIYPERALPIPPYIFGLWLGDGCESTADFAATEPVIREHLAEYASTLGCTLSTQRNGRNVYLRYHGVGHGKNPFVQSLHAMGVYRHKHIPPDYLTSSSTQRMALLAGLVDSDGYKNPSGGHEITQRRVELAENIVVLARSLGFPSSLTMRTMTGTFPNGTSKTGRYARVYLGMTQERIPVALERKASTVRQSDNDPASTAVRSVTPMGYDDYYGFLLDGNHLFLGADSLVLHNCGKDFIAGGLPLWWQTTRYPAKTILTGPTHHQVIEITWNELLHHATRWRADLPPLGGRITQGKYEWDERHFIVALTTSTSESLVGRLQGYHSPHTLVIVTEAQAVPTSIKEQIDGLLTSGEALLVAIGNPLVTTGWFAHGVRDRAHHVVLHLDCEQSPNVLEGREVIPGLVSREWVEDKRRRWYAEHPHHPLWLSRVKGQLPTTSVDSVFDRDLIERSHRFPLTDRGQRISLGVDVAEFGDDESVFVVLADGVVRGMETTSKHEPTDTAGRAALYRKTHRCGVVVVDRLGVGAGVASMLRELADETWRVVSFAGSERPTTEDSEYANQRAEAYFYAREQLHLGKVQAPQDAHAIDELCETTYVVHRSGKILLEPKADIKERLGRSPDRADAWVMAVWGMKSASMARPVDGLEEGWMEEPEEAPLNYGYGFRRSGS